MRAGETGRIPRIDAVAAGLLTVVGVIDAAAGLTVGSQPWYVVVTVPLATLPVLVRRRWPAPALLSVLVAMLVQAALGSDISGGFAEPLALVLVLYSVGSLLPVRTSIVMLGWAMVAMSAVVALEGEARVGNYVYVVTVVLAAWFAGQGGRLAQERTRLLAERGAARERSRIARELHDVVSHNVSAIVIQAAAERRDLPIDAPTAVVLRDIEEHGRQTLVELRRLLGLLRVDPEEQLDAPVEPQPGLDDLPRLVESMRSSGVRATLATHGDPVPVSRGLELAIYRVVQESLTNVRKHAGAKAAEVSVRWNPQTVEVEVANPSGPGDHRTLPGAGYGLQAIGERVRAYGGEVMVAGPTPDGFRVHVAIPVGASR